MVTPTENRQAASYTVEELEKAIRKLAGRDKVGVASQVLTTVGGAAAGASGAAAVASAAGATTIFGSTTLAGVLSGVGGLGLAVTPVGWTIACIALTAGAAYGVSRLVQSGARNDCIREATRRRLEERLARGEAQPDSADANAALADVLRQATAGQIISEAVADRLLYLVNAGKLTPALAHQRVLDLMAARADRTTWSTP